MNKCLLSIIFSILDNQSLFMMDAPEQALSRMKSRYTEMVNSKWTTLWELFFWNGESTYNHGWAGGPLTLLSQYTAGLAPVEAGFKSFHVFPQMGGLKKIET